MSIKSFHLTKPLVTHRAGARSAPIVFAGEASVRDIEGGINMKLIFLLALAMFVSGTVGCGEDSPEGDVEGVGARDIATAQLNTVAYIHVGLATISFTKDSDSESYTTLYSSNGCLSPHLTAEERGQIVAERRTKIDPVVTKMKVLADADGSGAVSDKEAAEFRRIYEFGPRFRAIKEIEGDLAELIAKACNMSVNGLRESVSAYNQLVERAEEIGLKGLAKIEWSGSG